MWRIAGAVALLVLFIVPSASAQTQDAKVWTGIASRVEVVDDLQVQLELENRLGVDAGFEKTFAELGLSWDWTKFLELTAQYRVELGASDNADYEGRQRLAGDVELESPGKRFRVSTRARLQSLWAPDQTKVTARGRLKGEWRFSDPLRAEFGIEGFYRLDNSEFRQYRVGGGLTYEVTDTWSASLDYLFEDEFNVGNPERSHIFALRARYSYDGRLFD